MHLFGFAGGSACALAGKDKCVQCARQVLFAKESARYASRCRQESGNVVSPVALVEVVANCHPAFCRVH